jgi:hypothetical protein
MGFLPLQRAVAHRLIPTAASDEVKQGWGGELAHEEVLIWGMGRREAHRWQLVMVVLLGWRWTLGDMHNLTSKI